MKLFSKIVTENSGNSSFAITTEEYDKYAEAIEKTKRSKDFISLLWFVGQYALLFDKEILEKVLNGKFFNSEILPMNTQKDIFKLAKKIGDEVKLLPPLLTAAQRDAVITGKIDPNDLTLDLETPKGRNAIAKRYIPLIEKIVRQYKDKSPLSDEELRSAAYTGLTYAMNNYKNPDELEEIKKSGGNSFTSYVAYQIKYQILKDITEYSRNVKISRYFQKDIKNKKDNEGNEGKIPSEVSIDKVFFGKDEDGDPFTLMNTLSLSSEDDYINQRDKEEAYKKIFARVEGKFSVRDCTILYKIWGIKGYKQEKVKDIAKEYGISSPAVVQVCNRIIKFVANDPVCKQYKGVFESLKDDYITNKSIEIYNKPQNEIIESFLCDDIYLLIESITKWNDKEKFQKTVNKATDLLNVDDALFIYKVLQNKTLLDAKSVKKYKLAIIRFLEDVYPDKSFKNARLDDLVAELNELRDISLKFEINW